MNTLKIVALLISIATAITAIVSFVYSYKQKQANKRNKLLGLGDIYGGNATFWGALCTVISTVSAIFLTPLGDTIINNYYTYNYPTTYVVSSDSELSSYKSEIIFSNVNPELANSEEEDVTVFSSPSIPKQDDIPIPSKPPQQSAVQAQSSTPSKAQNATTSTMPSPTQTQSSSLPKSQYVIPYNAANGTFQVAGKQPETIEMSVDKDAEQGWDIAPDIDGIYGIEATDRTEDKSIQIAVYDENDKKITGGYNYITIDLKQDCYYYVVLSCNSYCEFRLRIHAPNSPVDVTYYSTVNDIMRYEDQINLYYYTAPQTGQYLFDVPDRTSNNDVKLTLYDSIDRNVGNGYNRIVVTLDAGNDYKLKVEERGGLCQYWLNIGVPNSVIDITKYSIISDKIRYSKQINQYTYTAQISGKYILEAQNRTENKGVYIETFDSLKRNVGRNTNKAKVEFNAGETYLITVSEQDGICDYTLNISLDTNS